jgi:hypothetical protein
LNRNLKLITRGILSRILESILAEPISALQSRLVKQEADIVALRQRIGVLEQAIRIVTTKSYVAASPDDESLKFRLKDTCFVRRGERVRIITAEPDWVLPSWLAGQSASSVMDAMNSGKVTSIEWAVMSRDGTLGRWRQQPLLLSWLTSPTEAFVEILPWFEKASRITQPEGAAQFHADALRAVRRHPDLVDFLAAAQAAHAPNLAGTLSGVPLPFADPDLAPPVSIAAEPKRRSVLFVHNSYYHFNTLAAALQKRGWDAMTISVEPPSSPQRRFYFGEDLNLWHDDTTVRRRQVSEFLRAVPERFGVVHFYGMGMASLFHENFENDARRTRLPWDFLELRRHRLIIGFMPSGCLDGARQTSIRTISGNACARCVWELAPDVCNDAKSAAWADTLEAVCDWIGIEGDWAVDERLSPRYVKGPVVTALDPDYWDPNVAVPDHLTIERNPEEVLIYHAFGMAEIRRKNGRDIKGSGAVEAAVEKLRAGGLPVKLFFAKDLSIRDVRYVKAQADIVVDQLNYGRIGANARESFMMGKPLITRLTPEQPPLAKLRSVAEAPALNATEGTVEAILRQLVLDPARRQRMSIQSRAFALRWFAADACAHRFEKVIDRVNAGLHPESDDLYPPEETELSRDQPAHTPA